MAFYDYKCTVCNKVTTQRRPIKDMDLVKPCSESNCTGFLEKILQVGSVISKNVPLK